MNPNTLMNFAMGMINKNPNLINNSNPQTQNMLNILRSGDSVKGQEFANNLCKSMGMTPQEVVQQASNYFKL